jgi:serine O-acetyltransferase
MTTGNFIQQLNKDHKSFSHSIPDKLKAWEFIDELVHFLFPAMTWHSESVESLQLRYEKLKLDFLGLLQPISTLLNEDTEKYTEAFFLPIPEIYKNLQKDAKAIFHFDPAAYCIEEVVMAYPGFYAIAVYRLAHLMYAAGIPVLPRILSEHAHSLTGIDIHPGAVIGESFFIDHGTGIVIGETCHIGKSVKIYQGVTLGALSVKKSQSSTKRHPTIEDNVIIYSGTTILGGETVIGHDSVIGGNVWLTGSVQAYSLVYHQSEIRVRSKHPAGEPLNFII